MMMSLRVSRWLSFALSLASGAVALPHRRAQCASTLSTAATLADALQTHYYSGTGYNGGELWTDTNAIEDIHNYMLAAGSTTYDSLADQTRIGIAAQDPGQDWDSFFGGSYDDAQWVILAYWKVADYKNAHGEDATNYLDSARAIYNLITEQWDDTCGGGVWWSSAKTYKNAITNELFLLTSAQGYKRYGDQTMLDNAQKTWAWLEGSGMRNSGGLFNDGLNSDTCQNNGQTTWTYNQGVIASGLGTLASITGNTTLFSQAEITLDATIAQLTVNDILKESCDDAASSTCNHDQQIFKGIWTKHVQYYLDAANDASRTAKYSAFLGSQASAILHYGKDANNDVGNVWYAPSQGGSIFGPEPSASGLAGTLAAAKYGPC